MMTKHPEALRILLIDNYDSFTYNLYQYLWELGATVEVARNNEVTLEEIAAMAPKAIAISPGPGTPMEAGISNDVVLRFGRETPILGVCLGHQCVGHVFGGKVVRAPEIRHGKVSPIFHGQSDLFKDLPNPFQATRYHSLVVDASRVPACLEVTAWTQEGLVMGLRHREYPIYGVQFHPESMLTPEGKPLLANFLAIARGG